MDFYRLCLFSKGGIEGQNLDKVIFFQAIGKDGIRKKKESGEYIDICFFLVIIGLKVKFYVMIRPCSNIRSVIELATITIPAVQKDLLNFTSILDTLLSVTALHHSIKPNPELNILVTSLPTLPFEFLDAKHIETFRDRCINKELGLR